MKLFITILSLLALSCVSTREITAAKQISYESGFAAGIWYADSLERRWSKKNLSDRDKQSLRRGLKTLNDETRRK